MHEREGDCLGLRYVYKLIDVDLLKLDTSALPELLAQLSVSASSDSTSLTRSSRRSFRCSTSCRRRRPHRCSQYGRFDGGRRRPQHRLLGLRGKLPPRHA